MNLAAILRTSSLTLAACTALASEASAAPEIGIERTVGMGVELGSGPGLSAKFIFEKSNAVQLGLGTTTYAFAGDRRSRLRGGTALHAEYLRHGGLVVANRGVAVPWYAGFGGMLNIGGQHNIGVRMPIGLAMQVRKVPLDLFVEWAPQWWIGADVDVVHFNSGIRYWF